MKQSQIKLIQDPAGPNAYWVEWVEPFHDSEPVIMRVTAATAIAAQRRAAAQSNPDFKYASDEQALDDFIAVRWAKLIPVNPVPQSDSTSKPLEPNDASEVPEGWIDPADHVRVLEMKLSVLERWRNEALAVESWWKKVDEAVRKHPSVKLGAHVSHEALRIIQEHASLARQRDRLTAGLLEIRDLDYRGNRHTSADIAQRTIGEASKL